MQKPFVLLIIIVSSQLLFCQTKELPPCKVGKELTTIHNSFDDIVEKFKFKEDKMSLIKTYSSEFGICGEKGKIKDYGKNVEFGFRFSETDYKGNRDQFKVFYKKLLKELKEEFGSTHIYRSVKNESGKSCYFYEKSKEITSSKRNIKLVLSYRDAMDETEAYSVSLFFEYYPRR